MTGQPAPGGMPPAEIEIDATLVRALLAAQHPDLAGEKIEATAVGWDNCSFRIGDALCARLPRRALAAFLIHNEQRWLPTLAPRLPLPVPAPVHVGAASALYPWAWSIVRWLDGETADVAPPNADQGPAMAKFLRALHIDAPQEAPHNRFRGGPLTTRAVQVEERIAHLRAIGETIETPVRAAWEAGLAAPLDHAPVWLHGDMHPRNVLTQKGRFSAIIDWGDICRGDPATDLAAIWMLLPDRAARAQALETYGVSAPTLLRARGWAAFFAIMLRDAGLINNPPLAVIGAATMKRLADGP